MVSQDGIILIMKMLILREVVDLLHTAAAQHVMALMEYLPCQHPGILVKVLHVLIVMINNKLRCI